MKRNQLTPLHQIIYPTSKFQAIFQSRTPEIFAAVVALTFFLVALVFVVYDKFVQHRNTKIIATAARSNAVVSAMFPGRFRDQVLAEGQKSSNGGSTKSSKMKDFLAGGELGEHGKPLAEFFLDTTIMFADIVGFTAWSSTREPTQVFTLLETVFASFDRLARQRKIFKVETVGGMWPFLKSDCIIYAHFFTPLLPLRLLCRRERIARPFTSACLGYGEIRPSLFAHVSVFSEAP